MSLGNWLLDLFQDPDGSASSVRVSGMLLTLTAIVVAITAVALNRDLAGAAALVAAITGGGALSFFSRTRTVAPREPSPPFVFKGPTPAPDPEAAGS